MRIRSLLPALLAFCLAVPQIPVALAQNLTGQIDGVVRDPSGGLVAGAKVELTNLDQKLLVRSLETNRQGSFLASSLPVGRYSLAVTLQGFQAFSQEIEVHVGTPSSINVSLSVGDLSQKVTVSTDPATLQLDTAAASTLISNTQMTQLSLSSRNFAQLLYLQPGISGGIPGPQERGSITSAGTVNSLNFSVNGQRSDKNGYFVDGQDFLTRSGNSQPAVYPGIDFIQEINLQRSQYTAQYGGEGSAFTTIATRQGAAQFHGGAFAFVRSQVLNANGYFNNLAGNTQPGIRYKDYGYRIGGPVPFLSKSIFRNTFFYFGQELLRQETQITETLSNLPTAAQRAGRFAHPVCVTYNANGTCASTTTNITTIDPTAGAYLSNIINKTPVPNNPNDPQGLIANEQGFNNETQTFIRVDKQIGSKLTLTFRYIDDPFHITAPNGLRQPTGVPGVGTSTITTGGTEYLGHVTYVMTSHDVFDGGFGWQSAWVTAQPIGLLNPANSPDIRPTLPYRATLARVPDLRINGSSYAAIGPYNNRNPTKQTFLTYSHTGGRHTLTTGLNLEFERAGNNYGQTNAGSYTFSAGVLPSGVGTTNFEQAFANFLLGRVTTFTQTSIEAASLTHENIFEGFIQDDFRPTPRLTLNAGVRYTYIGSPYAGQLDRFALIPLVNFDPKAYSAAAAPAIDSNGLICSAAPCAGGATPNPGAKLGNGLIVGNQNSPYGAKVSSQPVLTFAPRAGFAYDLDGKGTTAIRGGYGLYYLVPPNSYYQTMATLNPPNVANTSISNTSFGNPGNGVPALSAVPPTIVSAQVRSQQPYVQAYSFDIQHQFPLRINLDVGYYGNHSIHLPQSEDINQLRPGAFAGTGVIPGNVITAANSQLLNQLRPYRGYGPIVGFYQVFKSNYNGLQASASRRFSEGSLVVVNYTFSKALSDGNNSPQSIYDLRQEYGPTDLNRTHIFNANFVYHVPFFRGQSGITGHLLGGFEFSGVVGVGSGLSLTPNITGAGSDAGGVGLLAAGAAGLVRPDIVGNPNANAPHTRTQWFNTAAFAPVPAGQYRVGNSPVGTVKGPGYNTVDLSVFRNFKLYKESNFQIRAEAFNVFNHTNFSGIATTLGNANFGQVISTGPARILQVAAKVSF